MEKLHSDIIENILFRLPIETALHAKHVSETWKALLRNYKSDKPGYLFSHHICDHKPKLFYEDEYDDYDHAKVNYYHSYSTLTEMEHPRFITKEPPSGIYMVGSCNGLVCFSNHIFIAAQVADPFLICNPLTGESVALPEFNYSGLSQDISSTNFPPSCSQCGFGYCPSTNDYKVVTICHHKEEHKGHVQVYTVGGEWRSIEFINFRYNLDDCSSGIYANGALHWLDQGDPEVKSSKIVAFDLEGEKFHPIPFPDSKNFECDNDFYSYPLKLLGRNDDNLYLVYSNHRACRIDIWEYKRNNKNTGTSYAMQECNWKQNYHAKSSSCWIKDFSIPLENLDPYKQLPTRTRARDFYNPFAITRNNEVLLWYRSSGSKLCCYDHKTSTLNQLWDNEANGAIFVCISAIPHRQSVVSLEDLGEINVIPLKGFCLAAEAESGSEKFLEKSIRSRVGKRKKDCC